MSVTCCLHFRNEKSASTYLKCYTGKVVLLFGGFMMACWHVKLGQININEALYNQRSSQRHRYIPPRQIFPQLLRECLCPQVTRNSSHGNHYFSNNDNNNNGDCAGYCSCAGTYQRGNGPERQEQKIILLGEAHIQRRFLPIKLKKNFSSTSGPRIGPGSRRVQEAINSTENICNNNHYGNNNGNNNNLSLSLSPGAQNFFLAFWNKNSSSSKLYCTVLVLRWSADFKQLPDTVLHTWCSYN